MDSFHNQTPTSNHHKGNLVGFNSDIVSVIQRNCIPIPDVLRIELGNVNIPEITLLTLLTSCNAFPRMTTAFPTPRMDLFEPTLFSCKAALSLVPLLVG